MCPAVCWIGPSDCADPFSSSLQYVLLSVHTQSTLAAPSELLKAGLGFYAILLNSESRLFTVMLPCISGRPVGSMGFGVREGSSVGMDGRKGSPGKGRPELALKGNSRQRHKWKAAWRADLPGKRSHGENRRKQLIDEMLWKFLGLVGWGNDRLNRFLCCRTYQSL